MTARWSDSYRSWGGISGGRHRLARPATAEAAARILTDEALPVLGCGCGRSYGDVALNPDGALIDCRGLDRFIAFDKATGIVECEAGVRIADLLATLCHPDTDGSGWLVPVTPGTRFVTVAGAIANDVHGKNHHKFGTFGRHVLSFDLLRGDGQVLTCSPTHNAELFAATVGGLGLTGFILRVRLQMRRVPGLAVKAEDIRFASLKDFFDLAAESDEDWDYTAAWVDCLASGAARGRGIYSRARHVAKKGAAPPPSVPRISVPLRPPLSPLTPLSVGLFNAAYWRRLGPKGRSDHVGSYEKVFYPLDAIGAWNRLYGPRGFYQFQCVVPIGEARASIDEMLRRIAARRQGSMLSVMKLFGDLPSPGLLSFPMPGATLALDFPDRGAPTRELIAELERITLDAGGRIYPAKDSLMSKEAFRHGFPRLEDFSRAIDPRFSSAFARRVGLTASSGLGQPQHDQ